MKTKTTSSSSWISSASGLAVFIALLVAFAAYADAPRAEGLAPDIRNGDAYRNTAIVGLDAQASFVRFANFREDGPVRNYVEIYSLDQQRTLGRFEFDVPAKASIQMSYLAIVGAARLDYSELAGQDVVLYVQNGREKQIWQHVAYDAAADTLINLSVCSYAPAVDYIPVGNVLLNLHTSVVPRFMSLVSIHNFADQAGDFDANVYDARNGRLLGTVPLTLAARSTFNESALWFEQQVGLRPTRDQAHINVELVPTSNPEAKVIVAHAAVNTITGQAANLSATCPIHGGIVTLDDPAEDDANG